ncbi:hypothetical protein BO94DRAFT_473818 [Aspergillus sclerotioniger CBS 115572]|uniref:Short-chain dehydrogenases/reductase n=1 Tax=Aspergillus sclerotioniger CBS 115572 TaxID=1450535 RepID=A0A317VP56_9EURO|nr:hypothetical protein BO94DRAFT_473818 [Aspergillus sclerotioniger CBS 115572]PWY76143.1 hypothetical protein BO94DRAFT_473818 [Aspergillus sclerotioniger CBS 115572]
MVVLAQVQSSNAQITTSLPKDIVALFVGATSGIGEATLKQFAQHSQYPRVYFVGRSQDAGRRIAAECTALNPAGEYIFIPADISLLNRVDDVCREIIDRESFLNVLFLSPGAACIHSETTEGLRTITALVYHTRMRFIVNLLPLLQQATGLRRVISVGGGGFEGPIDTADFDARTAPVAFYRGHITSMTTLALEILAKQAPKVSFVNEHPGPVKTGLLREVDNLRMWIVWLVLLFFGRWICIPLAESGERHLFLTTSAKYPARHGDAGVPVAEGVPVARGVDGKAGSGVYSVKWDGESPEHTSEVLDGLREQGIGEVVWRYTESQFKRITGVAAI